MGAALWAERARTELARTQKRWSRGAKLTDTDARIAELVAAGMTNRDVAATLFISPKTVEAHLGHIYRKLGIRRRTELARHIGAAAVGDPPESIRAKP
jgi:DNA-binding CsgD family transcriptional regulator